MHKKFTLLELVIVVAIIAILLSLLIPSLGKSREKAKRAICLSNQRQMHSAVSIYAINNSNKLPSSEPDAPGYRYLGQPGSVAYNAIVSNAGKNVFKCPSWLNPREPLYYTAGFRWYTHTGSQHLGNLDTSAFAGNKYITTKRLTDGNKKALFACRVEKNQPMITTAFGHSVRGQKVLKTATEPAPNGCEGTSVGRLDGSGKFEYSLTAYSIYPIGNVFLYFTEK